MNASESLRSMLDQGKSLALQFDAEWENGTGYYDGLVDVVLPKVEGFDFYHCIDPHQRLILIMPTAFGNIIVFERFSDGARGAVVGNVPSVLKGFLPYGQWSTDAVENVFAYPYRMPSAVAKLHKFILEMEKTNAAD